MCAGRRMRGCGGGFGGWISPSELWASLRLATLDDRPLPSHDLVRREHSGGGYPQEGAGVFGGNPPIICWRPA